MYFKPGEKGLERRRELEEIFTELECGGLECWTLRLREGGYFAGAGGGSGRMGRRRVRPASGANNDSQTKQ